MVEYSTSDLVMKQIVPFVSPSSFVSLYITQERSKHSPQSFCSAQSDEVYLTQEDA